MTVKAYKKGLMGERTITFAKYKMLRINTSAKK